MHLRERIWTSLVGWLTFSPLAREGAEQTPVGGLKHMPINLDIPEANPLANGIPPPRFKPPGGSTGSDFACDYKAMKGFEPCSTPDNRECWLRNPTTGEEYNVHSNYEVKVPTGVVRNYTLVVNDGWWNADGQNFTDAKLFNNTFPGPLLQGCWGDIFNVTVINNMTHNGTSIHWHGIRQHMTMHMDGVNGITQCPIAGKDIEKPTNSSGDYFVYTWTAKQYGSSWYHSHYSVQYADGMQGPMTIHGPTSSDWDEPKEPLLMTDWAHISAFEILAKSKTATNTTILLNGRGNVAKFGFEPAKPLDPPPVYELHFKARDVSRPGRGRRYLLRLINTSFDSTFIFSIDNHWMQIVAADFVPIQPYFNTSVLVGIGQRYTVIVEANPDGGWTNPLPGDGNFWIRTWVADNCGTAGGRLGYERTGILRYNPLSETEPRTQPWNDIALSCSDETYTSLKPKLPWFVGDAANNVATGSNGQRFGVEISGGRKVPGFPLAVFSLEPSGSTGFTPLQINYSDPSFLHLWQPSKEWPKQWVAVDEEYTQDKWVYLALTNGSKSTFGAHPIHLHGHDFAILEQAEKKVFNASNLNLKLDNPPRRDVVLLPSDGYVVIAFKVDNPGLWLMHCHIAKHASFGLGLQINERQKEADKIWPFHSDSAIAEANRTCTNWHTWQGNCKNHWPGINSTGQYPACYHPPPPAEVHPFQDDSGI